MHCAVAPKSICGSREAERGMRPGLPGSQGAPKYIQQGSPGSSPPSPRRWDKLGWRVGEEKYESQGSRGLLQRSPGHSVNDSSQAAKENGRVGGEGEGGGTGKAFKQPQLPDMCPHLCSVF